MSHPLLMPRRRPWPLILVLVGLAVLAVGWCGLWFYASGVAQKTLAGWFEREAKAGRIYSCGSQSINGFPFRIELHCDPATMEWRSGQPTVLLKTAGLLVAAQIYQPSLLISEFTGPLTMAEPGGPPQFIADWKLLQSSVRGGPVLPERASIAIDEPLFDRVAGSARETLFKAAHAEVHGRIVEGSAADNPIIDLVLRLASATAPSINPLAGLPFDADITFRLRGLKDFSPKPWPDRFREIQAAGGRIDVSHARVQQGESIAIATGSLGLTASGRLDGQLLVTVAGLERLLPALGLERLTAPGGGVDRVAGALDRLAPGLGNIARNNASSIAAGIGLLGEQTQLEGRRAVVLPLRFTDGNMFLGAVPVGQVSPLF
ncbi:MAG: hypothetical protein QOD40_2679 [Alphaproteobacteria bacterium]|nr:hypothetical protein [Alphaproteobacteria bacterium]